MILVRASGKRDDLAAIDIDRAGAAGGEDVGLVRPEVHGLDFQQHGDEEEGQIAGR